MTNNGVGLATAKHALGLADVALTERYSHLVDDTLMAALAVGAAKLHFAA